MPGNRLLKGVVREIQRGRRVLKEIVTQPCECTHHPRDHRYVLFVGNLGPCEVVIARISGGLSSNEIPCYPFGIGQ